MGVTAHLGPPRFIGRLRRSVSSVTEPRPTVPASIQALHVAQRGPPAVVDVSRDDSDRENQVQLSNRFAALSDDVDDSPRRGRIVRGRRRLVFVSQNHDTAASDHEWDPDTESVRGVSDVEEDDVPEQSMMETPILAEPRIQARARAFASLDSVNLLELGMTSDHLFLVLESERASELLTEVAGLLSVGRVPDAILQAIRLSRLTALQKPDGGVRGIVVGDIIRRLVARTMAKQIAKKVETATAPFQ